MSDYPTIFLYMSWKSEDNQGLPSSKRKYYTVQFKPDGLISTGLELLRQARTNKSNNKIIELFEEIDLDENENNNYERDISIDIID